MRSMLAAAAFLIVASAAMAQDQSQPPAPTEDTPAVVAKPAPDARSLLNTLERLRELRRASSPPQARYNPPGTVPSDRERECRGLLADATRQEVGRRRQAAADQAAAETSYEAARQKAIADITARQHDAAQGMGYTDKALNARIMLYDPTGYVHFVTFGQFLAVILQSHTFPSLHRPEAASKYVGLTMKMPGSPSRSIFFLLDDDELYLKGVGEGDEFTPVGDAEAGVVGQQLAGLYRGLEQKLIGSPQLIFPSPPAMAPETVTAANMSEDCREAFATRARGSDNGSLTAIQRGLIGQHIQPCWTRDTNAPQGSQFTVHLIVTTDAAGIARQAEIAPGDPAAPFGSPLHAFAERAVRATLATQCSALPLPPEMLGSTHRFDFIFKP